MGQHPLAPEFELENAAQARDLLRPAGGDLHLGDGRDQIEASGWLPTDAHYEWPSVDAHRRILNRRRALYDSMRQLEASAAQPSRQSDWANGVGEALAGLESALRRHITEIEGPDGLFSEVIDRAPHLEPDVQRLRKEHQDLVSSCLSALEVARARPVDAASVRRKVLGILALIALHRQRGSELLFDAYNVDLAAAD